MDKLIPIVTLPAVPGSELRPVVGSKFLWAVGENMNDALGRLTDSCRERGYDAVVGVQLVLYSSTFGGATDQYGRSHGIGTQSAYILIGTAIQYAG